jgi:RNA polymerase sigma-70 factor, ECF subfamily
MTTENMRHRIDQHPAQASVSDQDLAGAARQGCDASFAVLLERYQLRLQRFFLRKTGEHELAADLTQQTLLDAFRRLERFSPDRPFAAWLYRIAHYNLLHEWRRQRVRRGISLEWLVERTGDEQHLSRGQDQLGQLFERDLIDQALATLSPTLKVPLVMQCVYDFSSQEIATCLGISAVAARQRISRGKEQFRRSYLSLTRDWEAMAS